MLIRILNRVFQCKTIVNCDRQPYLTRWYVFRSRRLGLFLHRFHKSDDDRALHDHPWSFFTIILWRGYYEHTPGWDCPACQGYGKMYTRKRTELLGLYSAVEVDCAGCGGTGKVGTKMALKIPGMICWRPAEWRHRVQLVDGKPAWTLVIRFRERRLWGFWERTGFIPWNKWWQNNCE